QRLEGTRRNINEPYALLLTDTYRAALQAGEMNSAEPKKLVAYASTTIVSASDVDAVLEVQALGALRCYINGNEHPAAPVSLDSIEPIYPMYAPWHVGDQLFLGIHLQ